MHDVRQSMRIQPDERIRQSPPTGLAKFVLEAEDGRTSRADVQAGFDLQREGLLGDAVDVEDWKREGLRGRRR